MDSTNTNTFKKSIESLVTESWDHFDKTMMEMQKAGSDAIVTNFKAEPFVSLSELWGTVLAKYIQGAYKTKKSVEQHKYRINYVPGCEHPFEVGYQRHFKTLPNSKLIYFLTSDILNGLFTNRTVEFEFIQKMSLIRERILDESAKLVDIPLTQPIKINTYAWKEVGHLISTGAPGATAGSSSQPTYNKVTKPLEIIKNRRLSMVAHEAIIDKITIQCSEGVYSRNPYFAAVSDIGGIYNYKNYNFTNNKLVNDMSFIMYNSAAAGMGYIGTSFNPKIPGTRRTVYNAIIPCLYSLEQNNDKFILPSSYINPMNDGIKIKTDSEEDISRFQNENSIGTMYLSKQKDNPDFLTKFINDADKEPDNSGIGDKSRIDEGYSQGWENVLADKNVRGAIKNWFDVYRSAIRAVNVTHENYCHLIFASSNW